MLVGKIHTFIAAAATSLGLARRVSRIAEAFRGRTKEWRSARSKHTREDSGLILGIGYSYRAPRNILSGLSATRVSRAVVKAGNCVVGKRL